MTQTVHYKHDAQYQVEIDEMGDIQNDDVNLAQMHSDGDDDDEWKKMENKQNKGMNNSILSTNDSCYIHSCTGVAPAIACFH